MEKKNHAEPQGNALAASLMTAITTVSKQFVRMDVITRKLEMPVSHIQILLMLDNNPMPIGTLSERVAIAKPNITPIVDALCDRGLVSREHDSSDRRKVIVALTEDGVQTLNEIWGMVASQIEEWTLTARETRELENALEVINRIAEKIR